MTPEQLGLGFDYADVEPTGWSRLSRPGHKLSALWVHPTGWSVFHCGHPTANWPYAARFPDRPGCVVTSLTGRGWRTLKLAFADVEAFIEGRLALYDDGLCKHGHRLVLADPDAPPEWLIESGDGRVFRLETT